MIRPLVIAKYYESDLKHDNPSIIDITSTLKEWTIGRMTGNFFEIKKRNLKV